MQQTDTLASIGDDCFATCDSLIILIFQKAAKKKLQQLTERLEKTTAGCSYHENWCESLRV